MFPKINPTNTSAWQALQQHHDEMKTVQMKNLFATNPERYNKFSLATTDFIFDYSKNIINEKTVSLLLQLADDCGLQDAIKAISISNWETRNYENNYIKTLSDSSFWGAPRLRGPRGGSGHLGGA